MAARFREALDHRAGAGGRDHVALALVELDGVVQRVGRSLYATDALEDEREVDQPVAAQPQVVGRPAEEHSTQSGRRPGKTSIGHRTTRNAEVPA